MGQMADMKKASEKLTLHQDGTASYWSVHRQQWVRTMYPPIEDQTAMDRDERVKIMGHVMKGWAE